MTYVMTDWKDHVTQFLNRYRQTFNSDGTLNLSKEEGVVIQTGTPVSAFYMNHIERGIYDARIDINWSMQKIEQLQEDVSRLLVLADIADGTGDSNRAIYHLLKTGQISDSLKYDGALTYAMSALTAGTSVEVQVHDATGFAVGQQVTVYDAASRESDCVIIAIDGNIVTLNKLTNSYVRGAVVCRSNVTLSNKLGFAQWETCDIAVVEV